MENHSPLKTKGYYFLGTLLLAFGIILLLSLFTAESFGGQEGQVYEMILGIVAVLIFVISFVVTISALRKGKAEKLEYFTLAGLRFSISTVMLGYAFTKLHHGHMYVSYSALDSKLNDLNDFDTVWSFYGRYSSLQVLLGILELIPATLLLFRRTAFLGAIIMLPVISNVVLLNSYYQIGGFTLPVSALVLCFDLYVLYSYKEMILEVFRKASTDNGRPSGLKVWTQRTMKFVKLLPLCLFASLIILNVIRHKKTDLPKGAYELVEFKAGKKTLHPDSLPVDVFRKIYFEKRRIQSSLVNKEGPQGASIHFFDKDSLQIALRHGPLDMRVKEETQGMFKGIYSTKNDSELFLQGQQNSEEIMATYKRIPLKEFDYWWE